jgi:hypothetical protein
MPQRSTGQSGPPAGEDWPDDLWPADGEPAGQQGDPAAGGGTQGGTPPLPPGWPGTGGTPRARWLRPGVLAAVIIAGAVAGAVVAAAVLHDSSGPAASGQPPALSQQSPGGNGAPAGGGTVPGGALPGGGGSGTGMFVIGTVTAVSGTSITIGGPGHTIAATVTSATRVSGKVAGLGGIKVGDHVSAQLTQDGGRVTAVAIADPAQAPAGGSLP